MEVTGMNKRLKISLIVYCFWVIVTVLGAKLMAGGEEAKLEDLVKNGIGWQFVVAVALLFASIFVFKWRDIGFGKPHSLLKVMWFPMLLIVVGLMAVVGNLPDGKIVFFVVFNTFLVGVSEEVMFRGVLFRSLLENFKLWTAIIATTVLFGLVHVLNGFTTGEWGMALLQAVSAGMSGLVFLAIVIRTGSIWPAIIYHFLWDCVLFLVTLASTSRPDASSDPALEAALPGSALILLPLLIALPNFIWALVLLRNVRDTNFRQELS